MGKLLLTSVCKTCGGRLSLDIDTHKSTCASCGNEYDYEYFYSDSLLVDAKKALTSEEFFNSYDMYNFYLEKNPDSEEAFIGKLLSLGHFKSVSDITSNKAKESYSNFNGSDYIKYKGSRLGEISELFRDMYKYAYQIDRDEKKIQTKQDETEVLHEVDSKLIRANEPTYETTYDKKTGTITFASISKIRLRTKFLILAGIAILVILNALLGMMLQNDFGAILIMLASSLMLLFFCVAMLFMLAPQLEKQRPSSVTNRLDDNMERKAFLRKEIFALKKDIEDSKEKLENTISKIKELCKD